MFHCKCRALTKKNEPFNFTARDVPVRVDPDIFVLSNRPNTPLLKIASVCRVMDHLPLGEGDCVCIGNRAYTVVYHRGFSFIGDEGITIPANAVSEYTLISVGTGTKSKLQFKYRDHVFPLLSFFGCVDGQAALSVCADLAHPEELQVSAGLTYSRKKLFYGDQIDGAEVVMWRGRPCVFRDAGYVEIPTGHLIGGVLE